MANRMVSAGAKKMGMGITIARDVEEFHQDLQGEKCLTPEERNEQLCRPMPVLARHIDRHHSQDQKQHSGDGADNDRLDVNCACDLDRAAEEDALCHT